MIHPLRNALIAVCLNAAACLAGTYYVSSSDPNASDDGEGTHSRPWKTLAPVGRHAFAAGDSILFQRGSSFTGGFVIKDSGTTEKPITLTAYGTGAAPRFTNPDHTLLNGNVIQVKGSSIIVDGLHFHDGAAAPTGSPDVVVFRIGDVFMCVDRSQADPCGLPLGEGDKVVDPGFLDYAKHDYHLRPDSPAIDAGSESGSTTDFDGKKVPMGKARDIGAFEFGEK